MIFMRTIMMFLICVVFFSCNNKKKDNPIVSISTAYGDIELELYSKKAPKTVAAFLLNIEKGLYKNTNFYRVLKNEELDQQSNYGVIQGGIWPAKNNSILVPLESTNQTGLTHNSGTISMARSVGEQATTEFFICIGEQQLFNDGGGAPEDKQGFAAFGEVIKGMDVVREIQNQKNSGDLFLRKIIINNINVE